MKDFEALRAELAQKTAEMIEATKAAQEAQRIATEKSREVSSLLLWLSERLKEEDNAK
jgi:hypothetical protein